MSFLARFAEAGELEQVFVYTKAVLAAEPSFELGDLVLDKTRAGKVDNLTAAGADQTSSVREAGYEELGQFATITSPVLVNGHLFLLINSD